MRSIAVTILVVAACADRSPDRHLLKVACEEVREHTIALALEQTPALAPELVEAHRSAMRAALDDDYIAGCIDRGPAWIACARKTTAAVELESCASNAEGSL